VSATARDEVLARVRAALQGAPPPPEVLRDYRTVGTPAGTDLVAVLVNRLEDYKASVHRSTADALSAVVAVVLEQRGADRVVVPPGLPPEWTAGAQTTIDDGALGPHDLDRFDGVVTACAAAVAETGTIVLDASPDQGRRAITLVPDLHVCIVRADQIVASVPEVLHRLDPSRPLTFISGPSATSDIELERIEGVHGPRTLDVVLVLPG
jgi:L-lactate dehydrogenase complex protein LldG